MLIFFKKGARSGNSYISNRYSKANNKYLKPYDPKQESNHITYSDVNNLFDNAMFIFISTSGFKWIDLNEFDLNKYTSSSFKGCVLEIDLEYPKELREFHDEYPLGLDKIKIKRESCMSIN